MSNFLKYLVYALVLSLGAVGALGAPRVYAVGDATTVFLECDTEKVTALENTTIRCRAVFLTDNGEVADTIDGADIESASFTVTSSEYADDISIYEVNYTQAVSGPARASGESLAIIDRGWKEFAVTYSGAVDEIGIDTLTVKLSKGDTQYSKSRSITVIAPEANCYVVRTGQVSMPDLLKPIPGPNANNNAVNTAGQNVQVEVFAAYTGDWNTFYYTDKLPEDAEQVTLKGEVGFNTDIYAFSTSLTLEQGYATTTVTIEDLYIPQWLLFTTLTRARAGHAVQPTLASQQSALNAVLGSGLSLVMTAEAGVTRRDIGDRSGDVVNEQLYVSGSTVFPRDNIAAAGGIVSQYVTDTALFRPARLETVRLSGIPVNQASDVGTSASGSDDAASHAFFGGFNRRNISADDMRSAVSPLDAWFLVAGSDTQATSFKTDGDSIFAAICGYDSYDNPAPFDTVASAGKGFTLGMGSSDPDTGYHFVDLSTGTITGGTAPVIKQSENHQCFLPLLITQTYGGAVTDVYIASDSYTGSISSAYETIDSGNGMTFRFQDYFDYISMTKSFNGLQAGEAGEFEARAVDGKDITLRMVEQTLGETVLMNEEGKTGGLQTLTIDDNEEKEIAAYNRIYPGAAFLLAQNSNGAVVSYPITLTAGVYPADPGKYPPQSITGRYAASIVLDREEKHDEAVIGPQKYTENASIPYALPFLVVDGLGNSYSPFLYELLGNSAHLAKLEDAEVDAAVYVPAAGSAAADMLFPGASAKIDDNQIELSFDLSQITADQDTALVRLTGGSTSGEMTVDLKALTSLKIETQFVPVPGVDDTPLLVYAADQDGKRVVPVTQTYVGSAQPGIEVDITVDEDEGSTSETVITLDSENPHDKLYVNPVDGVCLFSIDFESDYGDETLLFDGCDLPSPPQVGDIEPIACGFIITITDDKQVDGAATRVTVLSPDGEDLSSTLRLVAVDNKTSSTVTVTSEYLEAGNYTVITTAVDAVGNESDEITRIVAIEGCGGKRCESVDPVYGLKGETLDVTVRYQLADFNEGLVDVTFSCSGVTVNSVSVLSQTELVVNVTIADDITANEDCMLTITTGSEQFSDCEFQVLVGEGYCSVSPQVVTERETTDITLSGFNTAWDNGTEVDFSCFSIKVNSVTALDAETLVVNVTVGDFDDQTVCTVVVDDLECGILDIASVPGNVCEPERIIPSEVRSFMFLPQVRFITIIGSEECNYTTDSTIEFDTDDITVLFKFAFGLNRIYAFVFVRGGAEPGIYDVSINGSPPIPFTIK